MKKYIWALIAGLVLSSCDDGDVIVTSFDFEETALQECGGPGNYVFFKINANSQESISLLIGTQDSIYTQDGTRSFSIDGTANQLNYRTFDVAPTASYFCNSIPPTTPTVLQDYSANDGTATLEITVTRDDNDGVVEDIESTLDTDGDTLLNFFDFDDDGDNVPTGFEIGNDPDNPLDTDGDGIFDYLDEDDDNDGVLTRNEDTDMDLDPRNDITDETVGADYLNPAVAKETIIEAYIVHQYTTDSGVQVFLSNIVLTNGVEQLNQENLELGEITSVATGTILITPLFK